MSKILKMVKESKGFVKLEKDCSAKKEKLAYAAQQAEYTDKDAGMTACPYIDEISRVGVKIGITHDRGDGNGRDYILDIKPHVLPMLAKWFREEWPYGHL